MKNSILIVIIITALLSACSNNGEKVNAQNAKKVNIVKTNETITYNNVNSKSQISWNASHLGGAQPRFGNIAVKSASILINDGQLTNASIAIDMTSFTVESFPKGDENIAKLTGHLQSPDFFNVTNYPTASFELSKLVQTTGDYTSLVTGNLTIMAITKSISFKANVSVSENEIKLKSENFAIDRRDWNLTYNTEGTAGVPVDYIIANDIGFTINMILNK